MANFDQIVLDGLEARRGQWQDIAKESGVSYSWLSKFANGHIPNPGYSTLCKLHGALDRAQVRDGAASKAHQPTDRQSAVPGIPAE